MSGRRRGSTKGTFRASRRATHWMTARSKRSADNVVALGGELELVAVFGDKKIIFDRILRARR